MKKNDKLFLDLIRVSIGVSDSLLSTPTAEDWESLFRTSQKQALVGICFNGLQKLSLNKKRNQIANLPLQLKMRWLAIALKIQKRNEFMNDMCVKIQTIIHEKGYRTCIIKGQSAAALYHSLRENDNNTELSTLRQAGDIDIWIEGGRKKVLNLVNSIAPTKEIRETHACLDIIPELEIEAHYRPGLIRDFRRNRLLQRYFQDSAKKCFTNKVYINDKHCIVAPTIEFHAVQQLLHIYHHLFDGGIGLRQIMDYFFVLLRLSPDKHESIMDTFLQLGVGRFVAALMYVQQKIFGLEDRCLLCEPNINDGKYLLNEILEGGNFGNFDKRSKKRKHKLFFYSFFDTYRKNLQNLRFAPMEWFFSPLWRIYYFLWRKLNGYN